MVSPDHTVPKDQEHKHRTRKAGHGQAITDCLPRDVKLLSWREFDFPGPSHIKINLFFFYISCRSQPEAGRRTLSRLGVPEATEKVGGKTAELVLGCMLELNPVSWFAGHRCVRATSKGSVLSYLDQKMPK